jgi:hypothetical protein
MATGSAVDLAQLVQLVAEPPERPLDRVAPRSGSPQLDQAQHSATIASAGSLTLALTSTTLVFLRHDDYCIYRTQMHTKNHCIYI